ncbi:hypothetical protein CLF_110184 [Clonorchis sinensis]|uniref:Uncharacterized protein n=1 Tax=Clonorchis sinensis TaxID=79923 RepID=G7YT88_CLOSI|nr:hypothetical protein CLF_110184 [Clonorchis sinensis]
MRRPSETHSAAWKHHKREIQLDPRSFDLKIPFLVDDGQLMYWEQERLLASGSDGAHMGGVNDYSGEVLCFHKKELAMYIIRTSNVQQAFATTRPISSVWTCCRSPEEVSNAFSFTHCKCFSLVNFLMFGLFTVAHNGKIRSRITVIFSLKWSFDLMETDSEFKRDTLLIRLPKVLRQPTIGFVLLRAHPHAIGLCMGAYQVYLAFVFSLRRHSYSRVGVICLVYAHATCVRDAYWHALTNAHDRKYRLVIQISGRCMKLCYGSDWINSEIAYSDLIFVSRVQHVPSAGKGLADKENNSIVANKQVRASTTTTHCSFEGLFGPDPRLSKAVFLTALSDLDSGLSDWRLVKFEGLRYRAYQCNPASHGGIFALQTVQAFSEPTEKLAGKGGRELANRIYSLCDGAFVASGF